MHTSTRSQLVRAAFWLAALLAGYSSVAQTESILRFAPQGIPAGDDLLLMVPEAVGTLELPVDREGDLSTAVRVGYAVYGDTALAGSDFSSISGWIQFDPGEARKPLPLTILRDDRAEETEYLEVVLQEPGTGFVIGSPSRIRIGILDAQNGFKLEPEQVTVSEHRATVQFTVRLPQTVADVVTVDYAVTGGTATAGEDYEGVAGTLVFNPGEQQKPIRIAILNDAWREHQEWFQLRLSNPTGGMNLGNPMISTIFIEDNDEGYRFSEAGVTLEENQGLATLTVLRGNDLGEPFEVGFATQDGSAIAGQDYVAASGTLVFGAGESSKTISLLILNDGLPEPTEAFNVTLGDPIDPRMLGRPARAMVRILDNDPGVEFTMADYWVSEASREVALGVRRGNDVELGAFTVDYALAEGSATAGADYVANSGTLSFAEGETIKRFTIPILNDGIAENLERFGITLSNPSGGLTLGGATSAWITIEDNDLGISFVQSEFWISEAGPEVTLEVQRGNDFELGAFTVDYALAEGSATAGADYLATSGTLSFAEGETIKQLTIPILNDGIAENLERFGITLSNPSGGLTLGGATSAWITIEDNDPGISFVQSEFWVSEAAGEIRLTVRRGNDTLSEPFTVNYSTTPGTATAGSDFDATTGTLAFAEGDQTQTIVIPIRNDGWREGSEYFQVTLSGPSGAYGLGTPAVAQITIEDNDPGVGFTQTDSWVSEGAGQVVLTVQRGNDVSLEPFDVTVTTSAGTATAGADFEATSGTLRFEQGDLMKTITVPIVNDALREEMETFRVLLSNAPGQSVVTGSSEVYVNIDDNDRGVHWVWNWSWVDEAAGVARIIVRRGNDVDLRPISVDYTVNAVSAKEGLDFSGGSGSIAFAEGDLEIAVEVPILNDALREEAESFEIRLTDTTSPVGLAPEPLTTVEIRDNDPGAGFSTWRWEAKEGQGIVEITVARGNDVDLGRMTVDYRLAPATAQPGQDYVEAAGTVVFEESEVKKTFAITLLDDADWEGDEVLVARLSNHTGSGTLSYGTETTVHILDDDPVGWELVRGFPEAGDFRDLAVGNGRWIVPVSGPTGAALLISGNGLDWERVDGMPVIVRLVYGAGEFLGITDQGEVMASTDGLDWELKDRIVLAGNWPEKLIYGGGRYLLLEGEGRTWVSADGQSWSVGVLPQAGWVRDVAFGAGVYVAVTDQGKVLTSANGLEWSVDPVLPLGELHAVGFGDGQFVAVGRGSGGTGNWRGTVLSSLDGRTWDQQRLAEDWWVNGIVFGDSKFVVVHESYGGGATIWSLARVGDQWRADRVSDMSARIVAYSGEGFVAVGSNHVLFSEDGVKWSNLSASWRKIIHEGGSFVVGVDASTGWTASYEIVTSAELEQWTTRATGPGRIHDLHRRNGEYMAVVSNEGGAEPAARVRLLESETGEEWAAVDLDIGGWISDAASHGETIVTVGRQYVESSGTEVAMAWTSTDAGRTWLGVQLYSPGSLYNVRWIEEYFLAAGYHQDVGDVRYVSPDGLEWTQTLEWLEFWPEETEKWSTLRVGVDGSRFWLRRGGQPWLGYLLPGGATAWDVTYAEGRLVAVGDRGSVWVSTPLILLETPWLSWDAQGKLQWNCAVHGAPGTWYELQTSRDLVTWTAAGILAATAERTEFDLPDPAPGAPRYYRIGIAAEP